MNRTPVTSTSLSEVGYDQSSQTLEITFREGHVYQYFNVPQPIYEGLMQAVSVGKFFNAEIRGRYPEARL